MSCQCEIKVSYLVNPYGDGANQVVIDNLVITTSSELNGKSYYEWTIPVYDPTVGSNLNLGFIISWNSSLNRWEFFLIPVNESGPEEPILTAYLNLQEDCPAGSISIDWTLIYPDSPVFTYLNSIKTCAPPAPPTEEAIEEANCFKKFLWKLQCKYAKCVEKYINNLKIGVNSIEELNKLINFKNILQIANCYNINDILYNVNLYNNISYSEIKSLLSKLK